MRDVLELDAHVRDEKDSPALYRMLGMAPVDPATGAAG